MEAASQVAPTLAQAITLQVAEWRNDLARSLDCRMIFMLRHLKNGHYRDVRYYTGVLRSFRCEPDTPEEVATGDDPWEELAKYTVRLLDAQQLVQQDGSQIAITDRGRDIVDFCENDEQFRRRHDSAFTHELYTPK